MGYAEFIEYVKMNLERLFETDELGFEQFTNIALKAKFGPSNINSDEIEIAKKFVVNLSNAIYNKSTWYKKLYYKYIAIQYRSTQ
jgi:hypothetical protein